jgi:hypothetical protein
MSTRAEVYWLLATLAGVTVPVAARAQGDSLHAAACARAGAGVRSGATGSEYDNAVNTLRDCPVDGPRLLAEQWTAPPRDSVALGQLAEASAFMLDERVFEAARGVVANRGALRAVRLAAMRVLVGHYDPCLAVTIQVSSQRGPPVMAVAVLFGEMEHNMSRRGSVPLATSVRGDVLSTLDAVAATEPDSIVREAARKLAIHLRGSSGSRC